MCAVKTIPENAIVLRPVFGLGNRLRSLASVGAIANYLKQELYIYWCRGPSGFSNIQFQELFKTQVKLISSKEYQFLCQTAGKRVLDIETAPILKGYQTILDDLDFKHFFEEEVPKTGFVIQMGFNNMLNIFSNHGYNLKFLHSEYLKTVQKYKPIERFRKLADDYVSDRFGSRVVGVHVRRGDHQRGEQHGKLLSILEDKLILYMKKISQDHENTMFYLSTDNEESLGKFESLFPEQILSFPKEFALSKLGQHKDDQETAWLEMQFLSRTRQVIGTMGSTFGELSAQLGGKPYSFIR